MFQRSDVGYSVFEINDLNKFTDQKCPRNKLKKLKKVLGSLTASGLYFT